MTKRNDDSSDPQRVFNAKVVLFTLRRWWLLATPLGLVLAIAACAPVYLRFKPEYDASAWLLIRDNAPVLVFGDGGTSSQFVRTQVQMIRGPKVLGAVLNHKDREKAEKIAELPELKEAVDRLDALGRRLQVTAVGGSELYTITYTSTSPEGAELVANEVAAAYLLLRSEEEDTEETDLLKLLEQAKDTSERAMISHRNIVTTLTEQANPADRAPIQGDPDALTMQALPELQKRLVAATVDKIMFQAELDAFKAFAEGGAVTVTEESVEAAIDLKPEVVQLQQSILEKRVKVEGYRGAASRNQASQSRQLLQTAEEELQKAEARLEALREKLYEPTEAELQAALVKDKEHRVLELDTRLQAVGALKEQLEASVQRERSKLQAAAKDDLQLAFAKEDLTRAAGVYNLIAARELKIKTEQAAPAQVTSYMDARPPSRPVEELPYKKLAMAALFGFCIPFGLAIGWEYLHQRVADARQLVAQSNIAVVGEIASLPYSLVDVRASRSHRVRDSLRLYEESVDSLRTSLVLSESLGDFRVLAVTSAVSAEGKTSVATQLAISLARATGKKTLLIDGDLRAPDIHEVFELPRSPGMAEVLSGEAKFENAVVSSAFADVDVLPAGRRRKNPHELFGNGELRGLIENARNTYRFVVIDTPPVLSASESLVLAKLSDVALICVRCGHSRIDQVRSVHERLQGAGARPVGATMIGVPLKNYAYRYGSYGYNMEERA